MEHAAQDSKEEGGKGMITKNNGVLILIAAAALFTAHPAFGQNITGLQYNGRAWKTFSADMRLGYITGFSEALAVCDDDNVPCHLTFGEIGKAVDRIYEEPENVLLTIRMAIHLVAKKSAGMDPAAFEKELAELRRTAKFLAGLTKQN